MVSALLVPDGGSSFMIKKALFLHLLARLGNSLIFLLWFGYCIIF